LLENAVRSLEDANAAVRRGEHEVALRHARRSAAGLATVLGRNHPDHANALLTLGRILRATGRPRASLRQLERAVAIARAHTSKSCVALRVEVLLELAECAQQVADLEAARAYAAQALRAARRHFGRTAAITARAHNLLGVLGKYSADYAGSARQYKAALAILRRRFGPESVEVSIVLHNIAGLSHSRGDFVAAVAPAQRSVDIASALLDRDDPIRLGHEVAYASVLDGLGRHRESLRIYRRALSAYATCYGRAHYEIAFTLRNLGAAEHGLGRLSAASQHYRQAIKMFSVVTGTRHPEFALTLHNLAILYSESGKREEAKRMLRSASSVFRKYLGPKHPYTRASEAALATLVSRRPSSRSA